LDSLDGQLLRARGGDILATQWRERHDALLQVKEELAEKVHILSGTSTSTNACTGAGAGTDTGSVVAGGGEAGGRGLFNPYNNADGSSQATNIANTTSVPGRSIEQLYVLLKDEYRDFRRRTTSLEQQRLAEIEDYRRTVEELTHGSHGSHGPHKAVHSISSSTNSDRDKDNIDKSDASSSGASNMLESKNLYIKQMVYQYLLCQEPEVRTNIEAALVAMFRFNAEEKAAIGSARQAREGTGGSSLGMGLGAFGNMFSRT